MVLVVPASGCMGGEGPPCTFLGPSTPRLTLYWSEPLTEPEVDDIFRSAGWTAVPPPPGAPGSWNGSAYARVLNASDRLIATLGDEFLTVRAEPSLVSTDEEAQRVLEPTTADVRAGFREAFGEPSLGAYVGGDRHCGDE